MKEETKKEIVDLQKLYPEKRSALIPALHLAQKELGYLSHAIQAEVAELFDIEVNEVNAVVTFYDMFFDKPVGKHLIHICKNISCMLRGCDKITQELCQRLRINPGETTEDGEFTVIASECLAACDRAPMMIVDEEVIGPVRGEDLDHIISATKKKPRHGFSFEKNGGSNA